MTVLRPHIGQQLLMAVSICLLFFISASTRRSREQGPWPTTNAAFANARQQNLKTAMQGQVATAAAQTNASEAAGAFEKEPREESDWFGDYEAEGGGHDENGSQDQDAWMQKVLNSFGGSGEGGGGSLDNATLQNLLKDPRVYNVREHLKAFTGLSSAELDRRLAREGKHHFEVGHAFADPKSATELAWFYTSSSEYLYANAVHPALDFGLTVADGPVLDYSAGVGNNVIMLASAGIPCIYFGIGLLETAFAEYRIRRLGLQHHVTFLKPYGETTRWAFDPRTVLQNDTYGTILAIDVLEHIPKWLKKK